MPPDLSGRLILLVDDSEDDRRFVRDALRAVAPSLPIAEACDGVEALAYLRRPGSVMPDLVLLDLKMPRKDGFETLDEIRRDETLRHLPVVAVFTTATDQEFVRRAYAAGANAYIGKPSSIDELHCVMEGIVKHWFEIATLPLPAGGRGSSAAARAEGSGRPAGALAGRPLVEGAATP